MIKDGYVILTVEDKDVPALYNLVNKNELEVGDTVAQVDGDVLTVYEITGVIKNHPSMPNTTNMEAVAYSKVWEHHVDIEV